MRPGEKLPPLERTFTTVDLFAYGAATWDWHRLHYDAGFARSKGLPAPVIDGQMYGALLARAAMNWAGPRAFIKKMSFRMRAMSFAGDALCAEGEVVSVENQTVTLKQTLLKDGKVVAEASTEIRLSG
jgi:hydroxyacyl-ACP dehydratase HTD2-like protein with hotdog domain